MTRPNRDEVDQPSALRGLWQAHSGAGAAAEVAYSTLRETILVGHLRPCERLAEEPLAREFGISRTPVREAICRLEAEHFAMRQVRGGLVVRGIPEDQVLEVFTVWAALDSFAVRIAAEQAAAPERARLHWINDQLEATMQQAEHVNVRNLNMRFHEALCEPAHNKHVVADGPPAARLGAAVRSDDDLLAARAGGVAVAEHRATSPHGWTSTPQAFARSPSIVHAIWFVLGPQGDDDAAPSMHRDPHDAYSHRERRRRSVSVRIRDSHDGGAGGRFQRWYRRSGKHALGAGANRTECD